MTTTPISSNQITNVPVLFSCIDVECKTLNNVLSALDTKLCEITDYSSLDFGCVTEASTQLGVLQNILDEITCATAPAVVVGDAPVTGLLYCSTDSWNCSSMDVCLTVTNPCAPGTITVKNVLQALIDRNVAYGNTILSLCGRITSLEATVAAQQLSINVIQSTCCV